MPDDLIYDWNLTGGDDRPARGHAEVADLTLRDGLQSPSVLSPDFDAQARLLHLMASLGIDGVEIGLPGAGERFRAQSERLLREIVDARLPLDAFAAARTTAADVLAVVSVSQKVGASLGVSTFIGASPIRQVAEGWEIDGMRRRVDEAVSLAVRNGLPVTFVTEDSSRSRPADLEALSRTALAAGATRLCICDTSGHSTPRGVRSLVSFLRGVADSVDPRVTLDWHGHQDRGLALANALEALRVGADRIHACGLGVGERVGNTPMELLLVNLVLLGWRSGDLSRLPEYGGMVGEITGVPIPANYPILGRDAFRTATGVHAAAIRKARALGPGLEERIYSGVPASMVGLPQVIEVGPMSGESNALLWLEERGIPASAARVKAILEAAKGSNHVLSENEIRDVLAAFDTLDAAQPAAAASPEPARV